MRVDLRTVPAPPREPSGGRSCDCGQCNRASAGWRYYPDGGWLPACPTHLAAGPVRLTVHDPTGEVPGA